MNVVVDPFELSRSAGSSDASDAMGAVVAFVSLGAPDTVGILPCASVTRPRTGLGERSLSIPVPPPSTLLLASLLPTSPPSGRLVSVALAAAAEMASPTCVPDGLLSDPWTDPPSDASDEWRMPFCA